MKTIEYGINSVIVLFPFYSNSFTHKDEGIRTSKLMNSQLAKTANYHLPIGILGSGLLGGLARD